MFTLHRLRLLPALAGLLLMAGCAATGEGLGYYWQSVRGHLAVMQAARPVQAWLDDPATEPWLRAKLTLAREARRFASQELGLPDNGSYTRYADLKRPSVVWNVVATPELSMSLKQWCYPVVGCATYRGFYDKADADRYAQHLRGQGLEAHVSGVPAYSTLGWFDDPLLSTFIRFPDAEVARTIFHELGHQVLYIAGDTPFNESFASAVEEIGLARWLRSRPDGEGLRKAYDTFNQRKQAFVALLKRHRATLEALYSSDVDDAAKRSGKAAVFAALQRDYAELKQAWGGFKGYDGFFAQTLGNAHLATVATYNEWLPGFLALYEQAGRPQPLGPFFEAVKALSGKPKAERERILGLPASQGDGGRSPTLVIP